MSTTFAIAVEALGPLGIADRVRELVLQAPANRWRSALLAVIDGEFATAIRCFQEMGAVTPSFEARHAFAHHLLGTGRRNEAEAELSELVAFYRSAGATHFAELAQTLLAKTAQSESA